MQDSSGAPLANRDISVEVGIFSGPIPVYFETHAVTTSSGGLAIFYVGSGAATLGSFASINWSFGPYSIQFGVDTNGGGNYVLLGSAQLLSVPYSLYSQDVAVKNDADFDPANELQNLSLQNAELTISGGNNVDLSPLQSTSNDTDSTNELQQLTLVLSNLGLTDGNTVPLPADSVNDDDSDPANELQILTKSGDTIFLSAGGFAIAPQVSTTEIADADEDTRVTVEATPDDDLVRFQIAGSEQLRMDGGRLNFMNSEGVQFLGASSTGALNSTGQHNTGIGFNALKTNTSGSHNIAIGVAALEFNVSGGNNIAIGSDPMRRNETGTNNVAIGNAPLRDDTAGNANVAMGSTALVANLGGHNNVVLGNQAGFSNQGSDNILLGFKAGRNETGSNKLYIENSNSLSPLVYGEFDNDLVRINGTLDVNGAFQLPLTDGVANQALTTDGAGNVGWENVLDNLGNHTATQNIQLGSYLLSYDSSSSGLYIDGTGLVGLNLANPQADFHVNGTDSFFVQIDYDPTAIPVDIEGGTHSGDYNWAIAGNNASFSISGLANKSGTYTVTRSFDAPDSLVFSVSNNSLNNASVHAKIKQSADTVFTTVFNRSSGGNFSFIIPDSGSYDIQLSFSGRCRYGGIFVGCMGPSNLSVTLSRHEYDFEVFALYPVALFSGNGNVGVGVTNPEEKLSVAGIIETTTGGVQFPDGSILTTGTTAKDNMGNHTATQNIRLNNHSLTKSTNFESLYLDATGSLGVNVPTPAAKLHVLAVDSFFSGYQFGPSVPVDVSGSGSCAGPSGSNHIISLTDNTMGGSSCTHTSGPINFNATEKIVFVKSGSVGTAITKVKRDTASTYTTVGSSYNVPDTGAYNLRFELSTSCTFNPISGCNPNTKSVATYVQQRTGENYGFYPVAAFDGGNVGIGVANPQEDLHLAGKMRMEDSSEQNGYFLQSNTDGKATWVHPDNIFDGDWFETGNDIYQIPSTGKVGIGTSTPGSKLHIVGDIEISGKRLNVAGTGNVGIDTSVVFAEFAVNGEVHITGDRFYVGTDGKVGVGTNSPQSLLHLSTPDSLEAAGIKLTTINGHNSVIYQDSDEDIHLRRQSLSNHLVLKSNKKIGIGVAEPNHLLHVEDNVSGYVAHIKNTRQIAGTSDGLLISAGTNANNAFLNEFLRFQKPDGTVIGTIKQHYSSSVFYNTSSDQRRKTNISSTTLGQKDLLGIQVCDYDFTGEQGRPQTGFIAQQLYEYFPQAVGVGGADHQTDPWTVDYRSLTPLLVKTVQERQMTIDNLKSRLNELQQGYEALSQRLETLKVNQHGN